MKLQNFLSALVASAPFFIGSAQAQWQTQNHSVPVGRGSGTGFNFAAPGAAGGLFLSNGAAVDPSFQFPFTSNLPVIGSATGALGQGTRSGNTTVFGTTSGTLTAGNCVKSDVSGNLVDATITCGGGLIPTTLGGTGVDNSTNSAGDVLASNGANGNFVHTALNALCGLVPSVCTLALGYTNIAWYGTKCNGVFFGGANLGGATNLTINSGSPNLLSTGSTFTSADVGKSIWVPGAGVAGAGLSTTILTFTNATNVVLAANARRRSRRLP